MSKNAYKNSFASDIFNNQQNGPITERPHRTNLSKGKTDVFNELKSNEQKQLQSHRGTKSQSDIFFQNPVKPKTDNSMHRNMNNRSMVFSNLKENGDKVKKDKAQRLYDPSIYYNDKEITPVKRRLYGLYSDQELTASAVNLSARSMTVKGFIQQEEKSFVPIQKSIAFPNKKRSIKNNNSTNNRSYRANSSALMNKIANLKSNIFNNATKQIENDLNNTTGPKLSYVPKEMTHIEPQIIEHSKWCKQTKWNNPKNEILFKKSQENQEEYDKLTAYQRKYNNLHGSVPLDYSLPKDIQPEKENIDCYIAKGFQTNDRQRKIYDNVSLRGFPQDFYKKNLRYAAKSPVPSEHEYEIKEGKGLEQFELQKMFEKKGMHVFDIQDDSSMIFGKTSYKFKIRENDQKEFNKTFGEVCQSLKKEKNIDIHPVQRITVNKLKHNDIQFDTKRTFELQDDKKKVNENHKADVKAKQKGSFTKKFSRDFLGINKSYKNDAILRYNVKTSF